MRWLYVALYFAGMVAESTIRRPYDRGSRKMAKSDQRVTVTERLLLANLFVPMLVLPGLYGFTSWLQFADYGLTPAAGAGVAGVGVVFLGAAVWLFWRAHKDLGTNWSPSLEIGVQHTLVTHGVYARIRHPMYASQLLYCIAQALLVHNWIAGLAGFAAFLPLYLLRVPLEERMMLDHFGSRYQQYRQRTGGLLPRASS